MAVRSGAMETDLPRARKSRFRPWLERGFFIVALGAALGYHFGLFGQGRQSCIVAIDGRPVVVMESRVAAERLLTSIREQEGKVKAAQFTQEVTLHEVSAKRNPAVSEMEAMRALSPRLTVMVPGAGIFVNGKLLAGLPNRQEAVTAFSLLLKELSPPDPYLTRAFKERVSVQETRIPIRSYVPNADAVLERVRAEMAAKKSYTVKSGDSPWKIANRNGITIEQLKRANPGVDFLKLTADQVLAIPSGKSPVTVVAWKEVLQPVGDRSSGRTETVRVVYENGAEIQRYIATRPAEAQPTEQHRRRHSRHRRSSEPTTESEATTER